MRASNELRDTPTGPEFWSKAHQTWYPLKDADMSHIEAGVDFWNEKGRFYGPRSEPVRKFMNNSENYYLEHFSANRSQGASMGKRYAPPAPQGWGSLPEVKD